MRSSAFPLAQRALAAVKESGAPDVILCSDMLEVPSFLGFLHQIARQADDCVLNVPIVTYFHENQLTYPQSPKARVDFHYGYTNLLSAMVSDACWFNSRYHLDEFMTAASKFIAGMPDTRDEHDMAAIRRKSIVIPPGFDLEMAGSIQRQRSDDSPIRIGWVSRWEYDKRPDLFLELLRLLNEKSVAFQLVLLGERHGQPPELSSIRDQFADRIFVDEFAQTRQDYLRHLAKIDVVVSTADHEFFGIAICEAIAAGAAAVLPNRLSYPDLIAPNRCYADLAEAVQMITAYGSESNRKIAAESAWQSIQSYTASNVAAEIDEQMVRLVERATSSRA